MADRLGFLGFGNMGQAIARGLIDTAVAAADSLAAFDVDRAKIEEFPIRGIQAVDSAAELARLCGAVILAPKPQDMDKALAALKPGWTPKTLLISLAAGISTAFIRERMGSEARVARVMPNTPAFVGAGAAGMAFAEGVSEADRARVRQIFEAVGLVEEVEESELDAVTALSGSGPAYYFYLVECFISGAEKLGLKRDKATRLAVQTLYGAGKLLTESGESPATLRERVTSKGGTTAAALEVLRERGWPDIAAAALDAAAQRSRELRN